jgi:N-glycosidase YbiA
MILPPDNRVLYFNRDRQLFRFLSHFWPAPIELDGEIWATVEHFYQAQKSFDPAYRDAIRHAKSPGTAKRLAAAPGASRRIARASWFRRYGQLPRDDWDIVKLEVMRQGDWAKFTQHPDLAAQLLATGDATLIEDAPIDAFWGTGPDGNGLNRAGRVLMEVRERLAAATREASGLV